jgi:choline dehydrogenase-like flavoprotein
MLYRNRPGVFLKWLVSRSGPGATNHFEGGGFARSNDDVIYPNLMFHFLPVAVRYDGSSPAGGHGYQVHIGPMYSDARGSVHIKSRDPFAKPALRFNYLSTEQDEREWVGDGWRKILTLNFEPYNGGELSRGGVSAGVSSGSGRMPRPRSTLRAPARWAPARMRSSIRRACACTGSTACASWTHRSSPT